MTDPSRRRLGRTVLLLGRIALGLIFIAAAIGKMKPQAGMPWTLGSINVSLSMFAMNVAAWGDRPVTLGLCDAAGLRDLADGLAGLAGSAATGEITWGLHQAAYGAAPC